MGASGDDSHCAYPSRRGDARLRSWQEELVERKFLPMTHLMIASKSGKILYDHVTGTVNAANAEWEAFENANDGGNVKIPERRRSIGAAVDCPHDALYRIYSMTKPITCVAIMQLFEQGKLLLSDPVWKYLGDKWKKKNQSVWDRKGGGGNGSEIFSVVKCRRSITVKHLLTHQSGISYGFDKYGFANKVDKEYYSRGLYPGGSQRAQWDGTLADFVDRLAEMPLCFQPGTAWMYGFNIDVLGRIVEVISGMPLAEYFRQNIFEPLGMNSTSYFVAEQNVGRFTKVTKRAGQAAGMLALGTAGGTKKWELCDFSKLAGDASNKYRPRPLHSAFCEGGSGLVSTTSDYMQFCVALLNGGAAPDGARILGEHTVKFMTMNHLYDREGRACCIRDLSPNIPGYSESYAPGVGFGLGMSVVVDEAKSQQMASAGAFSWGGAASTAFWCDPASGIAVVFMTALLFRDDYALPLRPLLQSQVYANVDSLSEMRSSKL